MILLKMKETAEAYLGTTVTNAGELQRSPSSTALRTFH
jgi:hypothetical protein